MNQETKSSFFFRTVLLMGFLFANSTSALAQEAEFRLTSRPGQPAIADGVVYVGEQAGSLHAVDMESGTVVWSFETEGAVLHAPIIYEDMVIFGSWDGGLRAVDRTDGTLKWKFQAGEVDWSVRDIFINGAPTIVDGVGYFSSEDFNVYAVDIDTGVELWRHTLGEEPQANEIPIVDGTAYIGAWDGYMYALDIDSGERLWRSETDDAGRAALPDQVPFVTVVPIITEDAVYYSDWAGNLFGVDRATGKQIWRFDSHAADSRHVGSRSFMAMHEDVLYFSTLEDKHLYGVDRHTGEAVWSTETEGIAYGPGGLDGGVGVYVEFVANESGGIPGIFLRVIDFESREVLWSTNEAISPPMLTDGVLYYMGLDGSLHGRDMASGEKTFRLGGL